jgi:hypothetical protein
MAAEDLRICGGGSLCCGRRNCGCGKLQLPGTISNSGETTAVEAACVAMKEAGAKRALLLPVALSLANDGTSKRRTSSCY